MNAPPIAVAVRSGPVREVRAPGPVFIVAFIDVARRVSLRIQELAAFSTRETSAVGTVPITPVAAPANGVHAGP